MKNLKKSVLILAIVVVTGMLIYLGITYALAGIDNVKKDNNPVVTMEIENYGTIKIELYSDMAPNTVRNFVTLANNGFYNGKTISEIEDGKVIGGFDLSSGEETKEPKEEKKDEKAEVETEEYVPGPKLSNIKTLAEGEEDTAYALAGEFVEAGFVNNTLSHQRGVISMARETYNDYQYELSLMQMMGYESYLETLISLMDDTATSGFFILTDANTSYDGQYAAFGKVIEGMEIVDKIAEAELVVEEDADGNETKTTTPKDEIKITKVTVDTKGVKYPAPETTTKFDFNSLFSSLLSNYSE